MQGISLGEHTVLKCLIGQSYCSVVYNCFYLFKMKIICWESWSLARVTVTLVDIDSVCDIHSFIGTIPARHTQNCLRKHQPNVHWRLLCCVLMLANICEHWTWEKHLCSGWKNSEYPSQVLMCCKAKVYSLIISDRAYKTSTADTWGYVTMPAALGPTVRCVSFKLAGMKDLVSAAFVQVGFIFF